MLYVGCLQATTQQRAPQAPTVTQDFKLPLPLVSIQRQALLKQFADAYDDGDADSGDGGDNDDGNDDPKTSLVNDQTHVILWDTHPLAHEDGL